MEALVCLPGRPSLVNKVSIGIGHRILTVPKVIPCLRPTPAPTDIGRISLLPGEPCERMVYLVLSPVPIPLLV